MIVQMQNVEDGPLGLLNSQQRFTWEVYGRRQMVFMRVHTFIALERTHACVSSVLTKRVQQMFTLHPDLEVRLWTGMSARGVPMREALVSALPGHLIAEKGVGFKVLAPIAVAIRSRHWLDASVAIPPTSDEHAMAYVCAKRCAV